MFFGACGPVDSGFGKFVVVVQFEICVVVGVGVSAVAVWSCGFFGFIEGILEGALFFFLVSVVAFEGIWCGYRGGIRLEFRFVDR